MELTFCSWLIIAGAKRAGLAAEEEAGVFRVSFDASQPLGMTIVNFGSGIEVYSVKHQGNAAKNNIQVDN
jgi:hypothetical protein